MTSMQSDEFFRAQAELRRQTLDSVFEENPVEDPESARLTRKHAALSMELEAFDRDPDNPLNRSRESIVTDLEKIIDKMKKRYE